MTQNDTQWFSKWKWWVHQNTKINGFKTWFLKIGIWPRTLDKQIGLVLQNWHVKGDSRKLWDFTNKDCIQLCGGNPAARQPSSMRAVGGYSPKGHYTTISASSSMSMHFMLTSPSSRFYDFAVAQLSQFTLRCHQTWRAGKWTMETGDSPS